VSHPPLIPTQSHANAYLTKPTAPLFANELLLMIADILATLDLRRTMVNLQQCSKSTYNLVTPLLSEKITVARTTSENLLPTGLMVGQRFEYLDRTEGRKYGRMRDDFTAINLGYARTLVIQYFPNASISFALLSKCSTMI
jgi:hypothetical protein